MEPNNTQVNKICKKCQKLKLITDFTINKNCKNNRAGTCRQCTNIVITEWKRKNSQRLNKQRRERYLETEGKEVKLRQQKRRDRTPLRVQCQSGEMK